jgi:outer membrane receptor protein involved in Fe transport
MNSVISRSLMFAFLLTLATCGVMGAQTAVTGAITGYISDNSGAAVADATVTATNPDTKVSSTSATNVDGVYRFTSLLPGRYTINISKKGFKQVTQENIKVDVTDTVRLDMKLDVGSVSTDVTVVSAPPKLQTDSAEISETIHEKEIDTLPTYGRNITRLTLLAPGVSMPSGQLDVHPENAGEDFNVNINGASPNNNSHLLDGVDNTEAIQGYSMLVTSQESVQEVKFTTTNYDAEFGRVGGAVIQVTTKSGTNDLHGSLFEYYRTAGFSAADPFSQPDGPPGNVWNQFGASLGGPIVKDKLFFFGDYQGMRNSLSTSSLYTVPTDAFKQGNFSSLALTNPIFDPATGNADGTGRTQFANNIIPQSRLSPAAVNLLALLPEPTNPSLDNNNYTVSRPGTFDQNQFNTRLDYYVSPKTLIFGKFSYFNSNFFTNNVFGAEGGGPPLGGIANSGNSNTHTYNAMADYQYIFSPTLLQDFRFSFSRLYIQELQLDAGTDAATQAGIPNINLGTIYTSGLPQFNIAGPVGGFSMGDFGLPFFETETTFEFADNWTKSMGRHVFKFGGSVEKFYGIRSDTNGRGVFDSSNNLTGDPALTNSGLGLASFLLGLTDNYQRRITLVQPQEKQWRDGAYFQDTWRVTPNLTLMLGLRWDYASPTFTPDGQSVGNVDLATGDVLLTNLYGKYAGVHTLKTEFSPRVGISYRVGNETVLRGGYARSYFLNPYGASFGTQGCCWPIKQDQTFNANNPYSPLPFTLDQGPGVPTPIPAFPSNGILPLPNGFSEIFPGVGNYPHSYIDAWNVTLEQAFTRNVTATVAYVGNVGRKLWDNEDVNAPIPGPGSFDPRRPYFGQYGWTQSMTLRSNDLDSNYNSLQVGVRKRPSGDGLYVISNFTWAKSLDYGTFGLQNPFNRASNYGNSDFVRPLVWITAVSYNLPFGRGMKFANDVGSIANNIIGGWTLSGVINLESGMYFTPMLANNASLNSTVSLRPDQIGNPYVSTPTRYQWFNPAAYTVPALYVYGNATRNSLMGPGFASTDLSLAKAFAISERMRLNLRWDVFNVFNRTNLANPDANVDDATAGQITSIVDYKRRMQIGAHFEF